MSMDDLALLAEFESCRLPVEAWTHAAHVRVAYTYLSRYGFAEALVRMRAAIRAYNAAKQRRDGPLEGYHETITVAWLRIVDATMRHYGPGDNSQDFCERQPHLLSRTLLRLYYTRDRLVHPPAKTEFVEPDIAPLPK